MQREISCRIFTGEFSSVDICGGENRSMLGRRMHSQTPPDNLPLGWSLRKWGQTFRLQYWPVIGCRNPSENGALVLGQPALFSWMIISPEMPTINAQAAWRKSVFNLKGMEVGVGVRVSPDLPVYWNRIELLQVCANQNTFKGLNYGHCTGKCSNNVCWTVDSPVKLEISTQKDDSEVLQKLQLERKKKKERKST